MNINENNTVAILNVIDDFFPNTSLATALHLANVLQGVLVQGPAETEEDRLNNLATQPYIADYVHDGRRIQAIKGIRDDYTRIHGVTPSLIGCKDAIDKQYPRNVPF